MEFPSIEGQTELVQQHYITPGTDASPPWPCTIRRLGPDVAKVHYLTHWQVIEEDFG